MKKRKILLAILFMYIAVQINTKLTANAMDITVNVVAGEDSTVYMGGDISFSTKLGSEKNGTLTVVGNANTYNFTNNQGNVSVSETLNSTKGFDNNGDTIVGALKTNGESNKNSGSLTINGTDDSDLQNKFENSGLLNNNKQAKGKLKTLKTKDFNNSGTVNNNGKIESSDTFTNEESGT